MTNLEDLINLFKQALKAKDDVIIDPYDFSLLVKLLPLHLAVKIYNELTIPTDEERAEMELAGDIELMEYEALITYNKKLYEEILKTLQKFQFKKPTKKG